MIDSFEMSIIVALVKHEHKIAKDILERTDLEDNKEKKEKYKEYSKRLKALINKLEEHVK
jgi:hypothetical protein